MSSPNDVIVHSLSVSQALLNRYTADLTPEEYLHRPVKDANCVAWLIGHLILSERGVMQKLEIEGAPTLPEGFEKRFSRDEGVPQAETFGDVTTLMPLFNLHRELVIDAVKRAAPDLLDRPLDQPRPPIFSTVGEMVNFYGAHVTLHTGQITLIRRSLGRPPLV